MADIKADAERVLKGISHCLQTQPECKGCPYNDICYHDSVCKTMVLHASFVINDLLQEQERSKHGHWIVLTDCSNAGVYCSECNNKMFDHYPMKKKFSQYCGHCGSHNDLNVEIR